MPAEGLTPTSYLVLGCVARNGPSTPYDLKQFVGQTLGFFWSFPHSQLYSEPPRLVERGLLLEKREESGRRRRTFSITREGENALREWLADPTPEPTGIRDVALLKLFFGTLATPEDVAALARNQERSHRQRLEVYETIDAQLPRRADEHSRATLHFGLAYERAAVAFWASIAERPPRRL
ncbi:MAG: PadR family transcriptional regulator [Egibacteraceae bacterium]